MIKLKLDDILVVVDIATILSLAFVYSLADEFGDLVRAFPCRSELAGSWVFHVLVDSA